MNGTQYPLPHQFIICFIRATSFETKQRLIILNFHEWKLYPYLLIFLAEIEFFTFLLEVNEMAKHNTVFWIASFLLDLVRQIDEWTSP